MLTQEQNETLTRVGPGTPMGDLMRCYWHPIAAVAELDARPFRTLPIQLLCEDLVLFRDGSGKLGLVEQRCAHRRVNLVNGIVEKDGLRCPYHGWKYDHAGRCIEQPFEQTSRPDSDYKSRCGIKAYPVEELAGLIWAYLGAQPAPLLPRWAPLVWEEAVRDISAAVLPCNWLQCQENSPDPVHTEWLHAYLGNYARAINNPSDASDFRELGPTAGRSTQKIRFSEFEYGQVKMRMVEGDRGDEEDWTVGHPTIFPNGLLTGSQWSYAMQFRVPRNDTSTYHVTLYVFPAAPGTKAPRQDYVPYRQVPLKNGNGNWILDFTFNQDYMAWSEQGPIAERHLEKLGLSDQGIVLYRQMLLREIEKVRRGEDPMGVFRDPERNSCVDLPRERVKHRLMTRPFYKPTSGVGMILSDFGYSEHTDLIEQVLATWDTIPEFARPAAAAE